MKPVVITTSILNADLARIAEEVRDVEKGGCDRVHLDVMDGNYVPNITFGPAVIAAISKITRLPLDVHLMIDKPERFLGRFAEAGASLLTIHGDATGQVQRTLSEIRQLGKRAGIALSPHESEASLTYVLSDLDHILIMGVNPGFGGQQFLPQVLRKIERVRRMVDDSQLDIEIGVDGGIGPDLAAEVVGAGASAVIVGHAVFAESDRRAALNELRRRVNESRQSAG